MAKRNRIEYRNKTFRMRTELLRRLERRAAEEEVSLNQLVARLLEQGVPEHNPVARMIELARQMSRRRGRPLPPYRPFTKDELHGDDV